MSTPMNRRRFLGVAASTGLALGTLRSAGRAAGESERILVAVMGTNGRGTSLARGFAALRGAKVAYVCDVDHRAVAKAMRAVEEVRKNSSANPRGVGDFRRILDDKAVDALVIAAPNHWHAPATILACAAGKHVYVEKPCSHNPREGELMVEAARKNNRVVQMGNQRRSRESIIAAIEEVRSGAVGRAYYSRSWYANTRGSIGRGKKAGAPSWLDYELWQGPAPRRSFRDNVVHYNWHWFWHWGNGELGNNGVHALDLSRWGLGVDYPVRVSSGGGRYHFADDQETPDTHTVSFDFEGRKAITWEGLSCNRHRADGTGFGASFHGDRGSLVLTDSGYTVYDLKDKKIKNVPGRGDDPEHFTNFLHSIRTGERPNADIEGGHKSTLLCHLGNIAQRTGTTLRCDPRNGHIIGNKKAMALWGREYESGWEPKV